MAENEINIADDNTEFVPADTTDNEKMTNIFDDFSTDSGLVNEVNKSKEEISKDAYYYMSIMSKILQVIFIIGLIGLIATIAYIFIEKNKNIYDSSFLNPFCSIIKDDSIPLPITTPNCSSIAFLDEYYATSLNDLKKSQSQEILGNLIAVYENDNILKSKDVTFLKDMGEDRLDVIDVMEKFDSIKKDFSGQEKQKLQCGEGKVDTTERIYEVECQAFSQGYENNGIIGFSGEKSDLVSGTSISLANSFLNYIEKSVRDFSLIDRQTIFSSQEILADSEIGRTTGYTKMTAFTIRLKINF